MMEAFDSGPVCVWVVYAVQGVCAGAKVGKEKRDLLIERTVERRFGVSRFR